MVKTICVSAVGCDECGDGSKENPYRTIRRAHMDIPWQYFVTAGYIPDYIKPGIY